MTHDIFISHASQDSIVADAACAALEQRGLICWIAPRDLPPGKDYGEAIAEAIAHARLFLLIFSAESNEAPRARREVEQAGRLGLPILGLRVAEVAPAPALAFPVGEWLDALTPPLGAHLDQLGDRIVQRLAEDRRGPLLPTLPPRPLPPARPRRHWLPIALAGLAGLAAIALAAAYAPHGSLRP